MSWKYVQRNDESGQYRTTDEGGGGGGSSTFAGLDDVGFSNLQDGQVPKYNSSTGKWENDDESGGTVTDVEVDGVSVVNAQGVAEITIPTPPSAPVQDVQVDGVSVVDGQGVADITIPTPIYPVTDVKVNGTSVVSNKEAQIKSYKEVTQSEYNALPASKLTDNIMYCIKDVPGSGQGFPPLIYSTEEREIGVWIDGKPLYEKSVSFGAIAANIINYQLDCSILTVDNLIDMNCMIYSGNGFFKLPQSLFQQGATYSDYGINMQSFDKTTGKVRIDTGAIRSIDGGYITLQYTKTTDTPGSSIWSTDVGNRGKIFHGAGEILTGESNDPVRGYGDFTAVCENGIAKIDFYVKITVAGSGSSQFLYGIQVSKLKEIAPSLPDITPIRGGIWKSTLAIDTYEHFGPMFEIGPSWWIPARYYTQNGDQGAWPASTWTVGRPIWGTLYGSYN